MTDLETLVLQSLKIKTTITRPELFKALQVIFNISWFDYCNLLADLESAGKIVVSQDTIQLVAPANPFAYALPATVLAIRIEPKHLKQGIAMQGVSHNTTSFFLNGNDVPIGRWLVQSDAKTFVLDHVTATNLLGVIEV